MTPYTWVGGNVSVPKEGRGIINSKCITPSVPPPCRQPGANLRGFWFTRPDDVCTQQGRAVMQFLRTSAYWPEGPPQVPRRGQGLELGCSALPLLIGPCAFSSRAQVLADSSHTPSLDTTALYRSFLPPTLQHNVEVPGPPAHPAGIMRPGSDFVF